ncbi:MAG: sodium:solute symporter family protein [Saprospiraceae bacterium]|nr:sodium:solute symporter family protein [Saprospiraceae bacterium]MBP7679956.1 sodium:solute symporter family protein [Saprospiraceae bacterium]
MVLTFIDYAIIITYFIFVIGIGFLIKRSIKSGNDFLMSNRTIPLWITSLAFISANLGAQEVIGMVASGAKYGIMTSHYYWVGAIPAMLFLGIFMMPFYYGSHARSVPEYLALRFDEKTRALNAVSFGIMTIFSSGISLHALALLLKVILGWDYNLSILVASGIVTIYIFLGGLTSAVYNEVLQFFLIVLGIAPLVIIGLDKVGGWDGIVKNVAEPMTHSWKYLNAAENNAMGIDWTTMLMGLGFVLSFGYWCTDFLVVQRAMIARNMSEAQKTPLIAAIPKALMPFIVIIPGLIAVAAVNLGTGFQIPTNEAGQPDYNMVLPAMLGYYFPTGLLGVGITALIASFMSGMAGNVTAFNTVWTYDIYQSYFTKDADENHYLRIGKWTTLIGVLLSVGTAYIAKSYNNIMDFLQLIFGFVNAPLFATFFLGMFWKRTTGHGAFWGLVAGTTAAAITHGLTIAEGKGGWLGNLHEFKSGTAHAFSIAIVAWVTCFVVTLVISLFTTPKREEELVGLVYSLTQKPTYQAQVWWTRPTVLALAVLILTIILNILFW